MSKSISVARFWRARIALAIGGVAIAGLLASCSSPSTPAASPTPTLNATWKQSFASKLGPAPGQLVYPLGIAANTEAVVVSDQPTGRILTFSPAGEFQRQSGATGSGKGQMWVPQGVALGPNGQVYVADVGNNRIQVFSPSGALMKSFGSKGSGPNNLSYPYGVAVTSDGTVYVADTGNKRIQKITPQGAFDSSFSSQSGTAGFDFPLGVALDAAGNIWVSDSVANQIREIGPDGKQLATWGNRGPGIGQMESPQGLAVDNAGRVYVTDAANNRVDVFSSSGQLLGVWAGSNGGTEHKLNVPGALAIQQSGSKVSLYIADSNEPEIDVVEVQW